MDIRKTKYLLLFLIVISGNYLIAQQGDKKLQKEKTVSLEGNIIGLGAGFLNIKDATALASDRKCIIDNLRNNGFSMSLFEFRALYKSHIGLTLGMGYFQSNLNHARIMDVFPATISGYEVSFSTNGQDALSPVSGNFSPFSIEPGLIGKFDLNQFSFLPYCSWSRSFGKSHYFLDSDFKNSNSGDAFQRSYSISEGAQNSYKFGVDIRYNFEKPVYIGLKSFYAHYSLVGRSNYKDLVDNNVIDSGEEESYSRLLNVVSFQLFLGVRIR